MSFIDPYTERFRGGPIPDPAKGERSFGHAVITEGHWNPQKYATRKFPTRVENGITIETVVEMYHGAPTPWDNRYACRVTDAAGRTASITECHTRELAESLALTFLKQKQ